MWDWGYFHWGISKVLPRADIHSNRRSGSSPKPNVEAVEEALMGLLRDESGYVLVLGRPRLMVVGGTAAAKEETKKPVENAAKPAVVAACSVPHYCFCCSWCGEQVALPTDKMGSPFGNPDARKIEALWPPELFDTGSQNYV